jgi:signal-transduction protein with cAMP-binding, CBS, and nucleotidyltransferase domain
MHVKVTEVMTRECAVCQPTDSLGEAAIRMWDNDCGMLPVVEDGVVSSVVTDRDICMGLALSGFRPDQCSVSLVASRHLFTCCPDDDLVEALATMGHKQVRRLPVVLDGRLVGILSLNDVLTCAGENESLRQPILEALESISAHRNLPVAV